MASFQRIFKVKSPTSGGFYAGIVGADKCLETPATCTLEGGVSADDAAGTVTINLVGRRPGVHVTSSPSRTPRSCRPTRRPRTRAPTPLPGTGAYMFKSYDPNKSLVLVRNPEFKEWSVDAQPDGYPDEIHYDFGLTVEAQITAIQNGEADWTLEQPPADRLTELGTKFADQVKLNELTAFWYAPLNVNLPPFDNLQARQAVNFAVDRAAAAQLFGGANLATPTCQILPPGFPGHEDYCPYTKDPGTTWSAPDLDKAKQLVQESGTAGAEVAIVVSDDEVNKAMGVYLQSVLNSIGYKASVKPISGNIQFTYIQNTNNKVQISVSQWYQDYPAASDFLYVLFGCASFVPGSDSSINISGFCDEAIDQQMQDTLALAVTDPDAANLEWAQDRQGDHRTRRRCASLFTPKHVDFVSTAHRQLPVLEAVLLDHRPVVGAVGPGELPLPAELAPEPGTPSSAAPVARTGSPWAIARRRLRRNRVAMAMAGAAGADRRAVPARAGLREPHRAHRPVPVQPQRHDRRRRPDGADHAVPSTEGLGLGVTPIGPTWDPQPLLPGRRRPGPRRRRAPALRRPQLPADRGRGGAADLRPGDASSASWPASTAGRSTACCRGSSTSSGPSRCTCWRSACRSC